MALNRREALHLLAATTTLTLIGRDDGISAIKNRAKSQRAPDKPIPNTVGYKLRGTLVGYSAAHSLAGDPFGQARTAQLLGRIARERTEVDQGRKSLAQASEEIRSA